MRSEFSSLSLGTSNQSRTVCTPVKAIFIFFDLYHYCVDCVSTLASHRTMNAATPTSSRRASRRVQDLLENMSVLDKIGQMSQIDLALILEVDPIDGTKRVSEVRRTETMLRWLS
jgi:hypothetical protein